MTRIRIGRYPLVDFRSIRVLDPNPSLWHYFKRVKGNYYIVPDSEIAKHDVSDEEMPLKFSQMNARQFSTLDIGDLDEPGIQGIAFTLGFFKPYPIFTKNQLSGITSIDKPSSKFTTQNIMIENASILYNDGEPPKVFVDKFLKSKYRQETIDFLTREFKAKRLIYKKMNIKRVKSTESIPIQGDFRVICNIDIKIKGEKDFQLSIYYLDLIYP